MGAEGVKSVAWDADSVNGKTSWDLLLEWLKDGCYDRWASEAGAKGAICSDFVAMLQSRGNQSRSAATTFTKIWKMEKSMAHAKHWLEESGHGGLETLESCDEVLKKKILRHCPHFEQLAPIMKGLKSSPVPSPSSKKTREKSPTGGKRKRAKGLSIQEEQSLASVGDGPSSGVEMPSNGNEMPSSAVAQSSSGAERPSNTADEPLKRVEELSTGNAESLVVNGVLNGTGEASNGDVSPTEVEQPSEEPGELLDEDDAETVDQNATSVAQAVGASSFDLSPLQQQALESRCSRFGQHNERSRIEIESERKKHDLELEAIRKKHETELGALRQKLEIDVETTREKCKIDLEQAQCDLQFTRDVNASNLAMERALSRQKLIVAGISLEEVDRILPSKPCSS